jgi:hypothetical protein
MTNLAAIKTPLGMLKILITVRLAGCLFLGLKQRILRVLKKRTHTLHRLQVAAKPIGTDVCGGLTVLLPDLWDRKSGRSREY